MTTLLSLMSAGFRLEGLGRPLVVEGRSGKPSSEGVVPTAFHIRSTVGAADEVTITFIFENAKANPA
jgi:hypothetical protein